MSNKCDGCKFYCNGRCFGEKNAPYVEYADCNGENNKPIDKAPAVEPKRNFMRIITTYCPDDVICYEEYKGKPYFSIEYQENGETFVGYSTYNPDVLSRFLRDYFFNEG